MKSKKYRKSYVQPSSDNSKRFQKSAQALKVKFNTSRDNIWCFISNHSLSKKRPQKVSRSSHESKKSVGKPLNLKDKKKMDDSRKKDPRREESLEIIRESSNSVLEKIEKNGLNCKWAETEGFYSSAPDLDPTDQLLWNAFAHNNFQKSFASTNDLVPVFSNLPINAYQISETKPNVSSNFFKIVDSQIKSDWRTTLMIRNIPNRYTISQLSSQIDQQHANTYDFLYLPCDLKNQCNVGYGFINFISTEHLYSFYQKFNYYYWKKYRSEKICALTYARLQGLNQLIEHFEKSKVLNQKDKKYRPIIKYADIHKLVIEQQTR